MTKSSKGVAKRQKSVALQKHEEPVHTAEEEAIPESLLSPELLEELGGDSSMAIMMPSCKQKRPKQEKVSEEDIAMAKKMSKSARKRLDQIQLRKERESKREEYLEKLKKHSITDEQQMLLTSTKLIGQTLSLKQKLKVLHRRHLAGLALSVEETLLLFPHGAVTPSAFTEDHDKGHNSDSDDEENMGVIARYGTEMRSYRESTAQPVQQQNTAEALTNTKTPEENDVQPQVLPTSWNNSSFMEQFERLKSSTTTAGAVNAHGSSSSAVGVANIAGDTLTSRLSDEVEEISSKRKYIPVETLIPLDSIGSCIIRAEKRVLTRQEKEQEELEESHKKAQRSFVSTSRTMEVQEARMELPVCKMEQEVVEAVHSNDVVIICGETGSGKSTQLPQVCFPSCY